MFRPILTAVLAGSLMFLGFAPYSIELAPILSCVLFLFALKDRTLKEGLIIGWCYGVAMFGTSVYWIYTAIHQFGDAPPILAGFITALLVMAMAIYPSLLSAMLCRFFPQNNLVRILLAFPALWVLFEILRGWVLTGFPWLFIGNAEIGNPLSAFAPIGGVWLVSWITVLLASLLYAATQFPRRLIPWTGIALVGLASLGVSKIQWTTPVDKSISVALVQGNVAQLMRWDPKHMRDIIDTYENLTLHNLNQDLIIWPEAAIPLPLPISFPLFERIGNFLSERNIALIAGVPVELPDGQHFYNSLIGVGNAEGLYHKSHLVPFGEYVPFERWLRGVIAFFDLPMSSMISGSTSQPPLTAQGYRFAPAVCYEIAYPMFVQNISKNADFILTVSNDTWFGESIGPAQHLQIAQFRALENGKYVLRATNTGLTTIIAPDGSIEAISPQFTQTVLLGTISPMHGQTPWNRWGGWPVIGCLLLTVLIALRARS
jgi:apolipoprotein N-acyltransferase